MKNDTLEQHFATHYVLLLINSNNFLGITDNIQQPIKKLIHQDLVKIIILNGAPLYFYVKPLESEIYIQWD